MIVISTPGGPKRCLNRPAERNISKQSEPNIGEIRTPIASPDEPEDAFFAERTQQVIENKQTALAQSQQPNTEWNKIFQ
jgi:hypothetical protein